MLRITKVLLTVVIASLISSGPQAQQAVQTLEGVLTMIWGDPHPDVPAQGSMRFYLTTNDGTEVELQMGARQVEAQAFFNRRVTVAARPIAAARAATQASAPTPAVFAVDAIQPSPLGGLGGPRTQAVTGTRRVLFILAKYAGDVEPGGSVPRTPTFYSDFANPDTPPPGSVFPTTLNGFFKKTSYNQFSFLSDIAGVGGLGAPGGWFTLPQPKTYYAPCGFSGSCANLTQIVQDAMTLVAGAGIDFSVYDNLNFVLSNDLDCCAWGGSRVVNGKLYGTTWAPPWSQEADTYSHEMSHSIGIPHSGWVYFAYDSPFDTMSKHTTVLNPVCGTYVSANSGGTANLRCYEPGGGFISTHKDFLGWIPASNQVVITAPAPASVALEGLSLPLSSAQKMIRICLPGFSCDPAVSTARYFTVEARIKALSTTSQYDNAIPADGIYVHDVQRNRSAISGTCFANNQSGWAVPIDSTPGDFSTSGCTSQSSGGLFNAGYTVGQSYTNSTYGFRVNVVSRTSTTFSVTVEAIAFTDPTLTAGTTPIKGVHITELRTRVNTQRVRAGLSNFTFTDPTITTGVTTIKVEHIAELRTALNAAFVARGLTPPTYTDPSLTTRNITAVKAVHIQELRNAVILLEGS